MMPPFIDRSKPQCRHNNDADNCFSCGTGRVSKAHNLNATNVDLKLERQNRMLHTCDDPSHCQVCVEYLFVKEFRELQKKQLNLTNAEANHVWAEISRKKFEARWGAGKCVHGHYLGEFYCNVCALHLIDPDYDSDVYRRTINTALANAKRVLRKHQHDPSDGERDIAVAEGNKDFEDLSSFVDLEIWKATKKYGDEMNPKLAYQVARNTAQKFIADLIDEQTCLVGISLEYGTDRDREDFIRLTNGSENVLELECLSKDDRAPADDRKRAKELIRSFGERIPRFTSFDEPVLDGDGEPGHTSAPETEIVAREINDSHQAEDVEDTFENHRPELQKLVAGWRGDLRKVGEAILTGQFKTRDVPGVSRSTASRLYRTVTASFRAHILKVTNG